MLREKRSAFRKRAQEKFEAELNEYMKKMQSHNKGGTVPLPNRVNPSSFDWLVMYQMLAKPFSKIPSLVQDEPHKENAHGGAVTRQAVTKAVKLAASYVVGPDFKRWLRTPLRGGRPPHTKGDTAHATNSQL